MYQVDKAVRAIIRPRRRNYDKNDLPLFLEGSNGAKIVRHPINFMNSRAQKIIGSIYIEASRDLMGGNPCLIYMHGNASSQLEGRFLVPNLCRYGVAVYCFDFAGCGQSEGDFISLGYFESIDVSLLISQLHSSFNMGPFVLWGRSMGAATALLVNSEHIVGKVVDSAYCSIEEMCKCIGIQMGIPSLLMPAALWILKQRVESKAGFDISQVSPLTDISKSNAPLRICHAIDDKFVPVEQGIRIFDAYTNGDKKMFKVTGGHNGSRPVEWITEGCRFVLDMFRIEYDDFKPVGYDLANQHFESYDKLAAFLGKSTLEDE